MKYLIILFMTLGLLTSIGYSQQTGKIIVNIKGFPSDKGIARSHLFNSKHFNDFPTVSSNAFMKSTAAIKGGTAQIIYNNVPYGTYAITTHHDENKNGYMDKNMIGYPKEGFGLSNNPKIYLSVPSFDKCQFELKSSVMEITIYLKFT